MDSNKSNIPEKQQKEFEDFVENEIPKVNFFKPDGKPRKEWKIFYGKTWDAARGAALYAAQNAEWGAARHAALVAAQGAADEVGWRIEWIGAWVATWYAALDAAWDAVEYAADSTKSDREEDMARAAAWSSAQNFLSDAAWDAAIYSDFIIVSGLEFRDKAKHKKHVEARWEVWRKGYGLLCDVDGVLYVYCKRK